MTQLLALLLLALTGADGATAADGNRSSGLTVLIDSCVGVDEDEVRRLVVMELGEPPRGFAAGGTQVMVDCDSGLQRVTVAAAPGQGGALSRTLDLGVVAAAGRDAKNRELALTIAELVRRGESATAGAAAGKDPRPSPPPDPTSLPVAAVAAPPPAPATPEGQDVRLQVGLLATLDDWGGGQRQIGPDAVVRIRLTRRLSAEIRAGGRRSQTVTLADGALDAVGITAAAGFAVDLTPDSRRAGVSLAGRLAGGWWWFTATGDRGSAPRTGDAGAVALLAGPSAYVAITPRVRVLAEIAGALALRTVSITDQGARVSALLGLGLSGTLGVVAAF